MFYSKLYVLQLSKHHILYSLIDNDYSGLIFDNLPGCKMIFLTVFHLFEIGIIQPLFPS